MGDLHRRARPGRQGGRRPRGGGLEEQGRRDGQRQVSRRSTRRPQSNSKLLTSTRRMSRRYGQVLIALDAADRRNVNDNVKSDLRTGRGARYLSTQRCMKHSPSMRLVGCGATTATSYMTRSLLRRAKGDQSPRACAYLPYTRTC